MSSWVQELGSEGQRALSETRPSFPMLRSSQGHQDLWPYQRSAGTVTTVTTVLQSHRFHLSSPVKPCQATTFCQMIQIESGIQWNPGLTQSTKRCLVSDRHGSILSTMRVMRKYSCLSSQMFYPWHCTMDTIVAPSCWLKLAACLDNNDSTWSYVTVRDRTLCRSSWESSGGPTSMYNDV